MAIVLKLKRDTTELSLQSGDSGLQLMPGWRPSVARVSATGEVQPTEEVLPVRITGTSHDNLAALMQSLHQMQVWAASYIGDKTVEHGVWLHAKMDGETGERRALVREIGPGWKSGWFDALSISNTAEIEIPLVREGAWERTASRDLPAGTPAAGASVVYDYTSAYDIVGDIPARLGLLDIYPYETALNCQLGKLWIGIRSANKHGTLANFINIWECEDGTNYTDATDTVDATASGGYRVTVSPGTETWSKRWVGNLFDVTGDEQDNFGEFLWLLRCKVTSGTWEVQIRYGYFGMDDDTELLRGPVVELDDTNWNYAEMGRAMIPLRDLHCFPTAVMDEMYDRTFTMQIWARRTSGSGDLHLDCLCPIPLDEGWLKSWDFDLEQTSDGHWFFAESPEGTCQVLARDGMIFEASPPFEAHNFRLPVGDGRMIIVYAGPTSSDITHRIYLTSYTWPFYERWLSLRGAE